MPHPLTQFNRIVNHRHIRSARLLRCLVRNAPPPLRALRRSLCQMLFGAPRDHRRDRRNAKFGRFFDGPLHAIELVDRHYQRNGQCRVGAQSRQSD